MQEDILSQLYGISKNQPLISTWRRFFEKVDITNWHSCWMWRGAGQTYGVFQVKEKDAQNAHKVIFNWIFGEIRKPRQVDHIWCSIPKCVNPLHLIDTTPAANTLRSKRNACAINARKTHCIHGHELAGSNLGIRANGRYRYCKSCQRIKQRAYLTKTRV